MDNHLWVKGLLGNAVACPCVFDNVEGCVQPGTYNPEDNFRWKLYDVSNARLKTKQKCYTHGRMCRTIGSSVASDLETGGLPCWDQSRAGLRQYSEGRTNTVFMCHAKRHKEQRTPLIILENVKARVWWWGLVR